MLTFEGMKWSRRPKGYVSMDLSNPRLSDEEQRAAGHALWHDRDNSKPYPWGYTFVFTGPEFEAFCAGGVGTEWRREPTWDAAVGWTGRVTSVRDGYHCCDLSWGDIVTFRDFDDGCSLAYGFSRVRQYRMEFPLPARVELRGLVVALHQPDENESWGDSSSIEVSRGMRQDWLDRFGLGRGGCTVVYGDGMAERLAADIAAEKAARDGKSDLERYLENWQQMAKNRTRGTREKGELTVHRDGDGYFVTAYAPDHGEQRHERRIMVGGWIAHGDRAKGELPNWGAHT